MLATIKSGPSGARSGSQTYWPGFRVTVSGETRTPSVKVSAEMRPRSRTIRPATIAINENKDFMALMCSRQVRVMLQIVLFALTQFGLCRARQPARNVVLAAFVVDQQPANRSQENRARAAP